MLIPQMLQVANGGGASRPDYYQDPNQQTFKTFDEAMAAKSGLTLEEYKAQPEENVSMQTNAVARTESDQWWHPSHPSLR
jgi:hypothetical protein